MDKVDSVNILLASIGEHPVNSLNNDDGNLDAQKAISTIDEVTEVVLEEGYDFNTENLILAKDTGGYIYIPSTALRVDTRSYDQNLKVVVKGNRLYDKEKNTFKFAKDLSVEIIFNMDFDDLPSAAKRYITIRAARAFVARTVGDSAQYQYTANEEAQARARLENADSANADFNMLDDSPSLRM